jgi:hypothetical protein
VISTWIGIEMGLAEQIGEVVNRLDAFLGVYRPLWVFEEGWNRLASSWLRVGWNHLASS